MFDIDIIMPILIMTALILTIFVILFVIVNVAIICYKSYKEIKKKKKENI